MSNVKSVSEKTFDGDVLKAGKPVMVDFWAPWCGPCKAMGPEFDSVAAANTDKVEFVKVNVDENKQIAMKYGIRSIPTIAVFNQGAEVKRVVGLQNKTQLQKLIDELK